MSAKIGLPGLAYAYIVDELSFGEETPDYLCSFYAGSFRRLGRAAKVNGGAKWDGPSGQEPFPPSYWSPKEAGEPPNGSRKKCPKQEY